MDTVSSSEADVHWEVVLGVSVLRFKPVTHSLSHNHPVSIYSAEMMKNAKITDMK